MLILILWFFILSQYVLIVCVCLLLGIKRLNNKLFLDTLNFKTINQFFNSLALDLDMIYRYLYSELLMKSLDSTFLADIESSKRITFIPILRSLILNVKSYNFQLLSLQN